MFWCGTLKEGVAIMHLKVMFQLLQLHQPNPFPPPVAEHTKRCVEQERKLLCASGVVLELYTRQHALSTSYV